MAELKNFRMAAGWEPKLHGMLLHWRRVAADEITADIKQDIAAHHFVTGELYRSIHQAGTRILVGSDHWQIIEYGSAPHVIATVEKRVLTDRRDFYGTVVHHPGTRAYAPVRRAVYKRRNLRG